MNVVEPTDLVRPHWAGRIESNGFNRIRCQWSERNCSAQIDSSFEKNGIDVPSRCEQKTIFDRQRVWISGGTLGGGPISTGHAEVHRASPRPRPKLASTGSGHAVAIGHRPASPLRRKIDGLRPDSPQRVRVLEAVLGRFCSGRSNLLQKRIVAAEIVWGQKPAFLIDAYHNSAEPIRAKRRRRGRHAWARADRNVWHVTASISFAVN